MKDKMFGRNLDHEHTISRMDFYEKCAYNFIYKDTEFKNDDWCIVIDRFIEDCIAYDMILCEHLYYPKGD